MTSQTNTSRGGCFSPTAEPAAESRAQSYPNLSGSFWRGSLAGQVNTLYRERFTKPAKIIDFQRAAAAKVWQWGPAPLTPFLARKLVALGIILQPQDLATPRT